MNPVLLLLEIGAAALFTVAAWLALRRGRLPFLELVSAASFGLFLEQANQVLYETYEYSPDFALVLDRSPIVIGLTWALIIAGAMRITDALGVRARYAPVVDSLLAIMLDLAFAARLAIHAVFLTALLWLGLAISAPVLLVVALLMLAAELPLGLLVSSRRAAGSQASTARVVAERA